MRIAILANMSIKQLKLDKWLSEDLNDYLIFSRQKYKDEYNHLNSFTNVTVFFISNWDLEMELEDLIISLTEIETIDRIVSFREKDIVRAARIREFLGIKGQRLKNANIFRDKVIMKDYFRSFNIPVADYTAVSNYIECLKFVNEKGYPVVIKPRDGAGSYNTFVNYDLKDLKKNIEKINLDNYMIESFVKGTVFHVDVLIKENDIKYISVSRYINDCLSYQSGKSTASIFLENKSEESIRVTEFANKIIECIPREESMILHIEIFDTLSGCVLCEIACRAGGGQIVPMIERVFGINFYEEYLYSECNTLSKSNLKDRKYEFSKPMGWILSTPKIGKLISFPKEVTQKYIESFEIYAKEGQNYQKAQSSVFATACFEVSGNSELEVENNLVEIDQWFKDNSVYHT